MGFHLPVETTNFQDSGSITQARKVELSRLSGMIGQIFDVEHLGGGQMVFKLPE
jgi:hypothetical protein